MPQLSVSHAFYIPVLSVLLFFSMCDGPIAVCLFPFISCIIALSNTGFINNVFLFFLRVRETMPRKRKGDGDGIDEVPSKKAKRPPPRNRASPSSLLLACKDMNDDRKGAIDDMDLTSLRNIQCDHLFNNLSVWLADLYDPNSREVVVPGRGRLPVNEEYVHRVMGVPRGGNDVPYNLPSETDIELGLELFGELGYAPKMTDLVDLIKGSENSDDTFKRMWLLLAGNTVIAPTTSNKVSPRWYAVLVSFFVNMSFSFLCA